MMANEKSERGGGYPADVVEGPLDTKFLCGACRMMLRLPVQSTCGHRFCEGCFQGLMSSAQEPVCPGCTEDGDHAIISKEGIFPDMAIRREMKILKVSCPFPGCTWHGVFADFTLHESECKFRKKTCPGCGEGVARGEEGDHNLACPSRSDGILLKEQVADLKKRVCKLEESLKNDSHVSEVDTGTGTNAIQENMDALKDQLNVHEEAVKAYHDMFVVVNREVERNALCINQLKESLKEACSKIEEHGKKLKVLERKSRK